MKILYAILFPVLLFAQFDGFGGNDGYIQQSEESVDPLILFWVKGTTGVTTAGGSVSLWADQSSYSRDVSQGTSANQPTHSGITYGVTFATDDYLSNDGDFLDISGDYSIQVYFKTGSDVTTTQRVWYAYDSDNSGGQTYYISTGYIRFYWKVAGGASVSAGRAVSINTTYLITVNVDRDGNLSSYLDNQSASSSTDISSISGSVGNGTYPMYLGRGNSGNYFNGVIYEVKIKKELQDLTARQTYYNELQARY